MFQKLWTQGSCNIIYRRYVVCIKYIIVNNPHKGGDDDDDNDNTNNKLIFINVLAQHHKCQS